MKKILLVLIAVLLTACAPGKRLGRPGSLPGVGPIGSGAPERAASSALIEEGKLALERGLYDRSLDRFQEAVTLDPSNGVGFYYLAFVKLRTGEYGEVWGLLEKAESLLTGNAEWILKIEELKQELHQKKPD